jgi:alkylphenol/PAH-inducible cytochrome P450 monooxygenase
VSSSSLFIKHRLICFPSLIEIQDIAADLVKNFKRSLPDDNPGILHIPVGVMGPMVKGKPHEGMQMSLCVTAP